jgi:hypothetical protein
MKRFLNILILILANLSALAQIDSVDLAITKCQSGDVKIAKEIIDKVQSSSVYSKDSRTWIYKGFIYKEFAKQSPENAWQIRNEAIAALDLAQKLDVNKENTEDIRKQLNHLLTLFYNEAAKNIQAGNIENASNLYSTFLKHMPKVDSSFDAKKKEVEFLLAAATSQTQFYNSDWKNNSPLIEKIEQTYNKVLSIDPKNYSANYNLGMLYYNHAVHIINDMEYDLDLIALNDIEDKTIALFKKALPFEHKADEIIPNRRETLMALQGIYFSLNDFEKSNYYKEQLDKLSK